MPLDSITLKGFVESQGWTAYGVVSLTEVQKALSRHERIFERWLAQGFDAGMNYLKIMKGDRYHPENKLAGLKTVLVLQAWYGNSQDRKHVADSGQVARYAWGRDYHRVLKKRLKALSEWLEAEDPGMRTYASVDSGPMVDRVLAEAAGLGFFGKNSNLIDPKKGSYFFIASMLCSADLPLTQNRRMPSCGDCNKCVSACPAGALPAPYMLDARRCIAYLTIENKEGIPPDLRPAIGGRLFGCDICQEVCPFNADRPRLQVALMPDLRPENGVGERLDLREILFLKDDKAFLDRFAGTPLMRAGRRGLLRNACVVAGNVGTLELIPVLNAFIEKEGDAMLLEHALWAVKQIEQKAK